MNLTGQKRCTRRKTCPSANLSATNPSRSDLGWKLSLRDGRSTTNRLNPGMASRYVPNVIHVYKISAYFTVNNESVHKNDVPLNAGSPDHRYMLVSTQVQCGSTWLSL
jgi:hypothetical protein